jgi:hypothetical protein
MGKSSSKSKKTAKSKSKTEKIHPWRLCPAGEHSVVTHPLHVPPSQTSPEGKITTRHFHCAKNPSGKDELHPLEMGQISSQHFSNLNDKPCPMGFKFGDKGNQYDDLIAGWTQYWNGVLKPDVPLDPNLVKALIASESSFRATKLANPKDPNSARGLMQVTNDTRKILGNAKGEVKDHLIIVTRDDLNDPNTNICSGIRWLFHKRALATHDFGRPATWEEAVAYYKSLWKDLDKGQERAKELMNRFLKHLDDFRRCEK